MNLRSIFLRWKRPWGATKFEREIWGETNADRRKARQQVAKGFAKARRLAKENR